MFYTEIASLIYSTNILFILNNVQDLFNLAWILFSVIIIVFLALTFFQHRYLRRKIQYFEKKVYERTDELKKSRTLLITELEERLQAEEELRISQSQLKEVWEKSNDGMRITDGNGIIVKVNEAFCRMVRRTKSELEGEPFSIIYQTMDQGKVLITYKERFASKKIAKYFEREFVLWDGSKIWFGVSSSYLEFENNPPQLLLIFRNITEEKNEQYALQQYANELEILNKKLLKSEDQLKELNANKDKFFSIISHDLRSPFNSILGFSDILINEFETLSDEEKKSFTNSIQKSTRKLYNLLDDLLQWSRLQTGHFEFNPEKLFLKHIIDNNIALLIGNAMLKNITIYNDVDPFVQVYADEKMLSSIVQNLFSNSIKFTSANGEIKVNSRTNGNFVEVTVKDNGIGIKQEDIDNIFAFKKNVQTGTAMEKGTGLGLVICKEFVELNGGKISAESCDEKGTTFKFTIPISKDYIHSNTKIE